MLIAKSRKTMKKILTSISIVSKDNNQYHYKNKAFTFVELIISITIIAILSVLWFVSYKWHISSSRDSVRKSELSDIYSLLDSYNIKWPLPVPEKKINIYSLWVLVAYQWYAWKSVLSKIWFKWTGKDPLDNIYYTYYLTKDLRDVWIMWFLENDTNNEESYKIDILQSTYAIDYTKRYPIVYWKKLWILIEGWTNTPIQENIQIQWSWSIDIWMTTNSLTTFQYNNFDI